MSAMLVPMITVGSALILMRPELLLPAATGLLGCPVIHVIILKTAYILAPASSGYWLKPALYGPAPWGIPLDEIVWSAAFGAVWPLIAASSLDVRITGGRPVTPGVGAR